MFPKWRHFLFAIVISLVLFLVYRLLMENEEAKFYTPKHISVVLASENATSGTNPFLVKKTDERLQISQYVARFNSNLTGKEFSYDNMTLDIVKNVLRNQTFKRNPVESVDARTPFFNIVVPVTGCSSNHYGEFKGHYGDFKKQFPGVKLFFYDLGLSDSQANEVKMMPFMEYRKFNFEAYPPHVRNLHNYAWKPLIIQQMLAEFDGAMWFDSSLKFLNGNLTHAIMEQLALRKVGVMFYSTTHHSIITATHPGMMAYFPMEKSGAVKNMLAGGAVVYINKEEVQKHIMKWLVICALKSDCIAPPGSKLFCNFKFSPRDKFTGCHRYDQSLQSILVSNAYNHEQEKYLYMDESFSIVQRG